MRCHQDRSPYPPDLGCLDTRQCTASCSFRTVIGVRIRCEQSRARSRFPLQPSAAGFIASMRSAFQLPCVPRSGGGPSFIHWQAALFIRTGGSSRALYKCQMLCATARPARPGARLGSLQPQLKCRGIAMAIYFSA